MRLKEKYLKYYQKLLFILDELDAICAYDQAINDDEIPFEKAIGEIEKNVHELRKKLGLEFY